MYASLESGNSIFQNEAFEAFKNASSLEEIQQSQVEFMQFFDGQKFYDSKGTIQDYSSNAFQQTRTLNENLTNLGAGIAFEKKEGSSEFSQRNPLVEQYLQTIDPSGEEKSE